MPDGGVVGQVEPCGLAFGALGEPHVSAVEFADIDQLPGGEQPVPDGSASCTADAGMASSTRVQPVPGVPGDHREHLFGDVVVGEFRLVLDLVGVLPGPGEVDRLGVVVGCPSGLSGCVAGCVLGPSG
jgi:hypothetical protein